MLVRYCPSYSLYLSEIQKRGEDIMNQYFKEFINDLEFDKEQVHNNLMFIPITSSKKHDFGFLSLNKAFEDGLVEIKELDDDGSVPEVKVYNKSEQFLIIFDGEHLIGAKQNRIVNKTIIINPFSEIVVPVSCTEAGRWHHNSEGFSKSKYNAPMKMRKASKQGEDSQSEVWDHVAAFMQTAELQSPTSSLHEVFEEVSPSFDDYREKITKLPSQVGVIVYVNGVFTGLDILGDPKLFSDLYENLMNSYLIEGLDKPDENRVENNSQNLTKEILDELIQSRLTKGKSIGAEGRENIKGRKTLGEFVSFNKAPIHIALFHNQD